jgi:hypothetical protein
MGFMYVATFEDVTISTAGAHDCFEILPATQRPIVIHAVSLSQNTDIQDAGEFMARVRLIRGFTGSGSGGTAATEIALDPSAPTASAAVETNNTTVATTGTGVDVWAEAFNVRTGFLWMPTPEMRPTVRNAELFCVRLAAQLTSAVDMSGSMVWEEL